MPHAVTHVIITLIITSLIRDYYIKKRGKESFPLHYVLIGGVAGLLPDIDIILYWGLHFLSIRLEEVHRTFTHTIFFPLFFLLLAFIFARYKNAEIGKHHMALKGIFLMLSLGSFIHLILDVSLAGLIRPFYPFSTFTLGFSVINYLPQPLAGLFFPSLDAILLVLWLIYIELKHKISDFI